LRNYIYSKFQGNAIRELAYNFLDENTYQEELRVCEVSHLVCPSQDAQVLTNRLFPEFLHTGESLGNDSNGNPVSSSLNRFDLLPKVREISLELFGRVIEIPNPMMLPEGQPSSGNPNTGDEWN
jgi:hypothetical protein